MDERCRLTHAKLLAGTCPWCGQPIIKGQPPFPAAVPSSSAISLKELVARSGPLDCGTTARIIEQVAQQLQQMHGSGNVHRDLRPDCIFVDETGKAKLTTSLAAPLDTGASYNSSDAQEAALSCADFLAPEQVIGSQLPDTRSDIYSLGCTMYFLLTARPPFPTGSVSERLLNHQTTKPPAIQSLRSDVPIALAAICEKMMEKKPIERFQLASDVADAITVWRVESDG